PGWSCDVCRVAERLGTGAGATSVRLAEWALFREKGPCGAPTEHAMSTDITNLKTPATGPSGAGAVLRAAAATPRLYVYLACTLLTVVVGSVLGKDTRWDTLDYHF